MKETKGIPLQLDMGPITYFSRNVADFNLKEFEFCTFVFALPKQSGRYWLEWRDGQLNGIAVRVRNFIVSSKDTDPFAVLLERMQVGVNLPGIDTLPLVYFSDHRGRYPAFFAEVLITVPIAYWTKEEPDPEPLTGFSPDKDKLFALRVWNQAATPQDRLIQVDDEDVSLFGQFYFKRSTQIPYIARYVAFTNRSAYRDGIKDYLFSAEIRSLLQEVQTSRGVDLVQIDTEDDLRDLVKSIVEDVFVFHIQMRRWIEAFWDGKRRAVVNGKSVEIPAEPKTEIKIQPTVFVLFYELLTPYGVQLVRETNEGIGLLDFRCLYTTAANAPINVAVELKLAHHKRLKHGLTRQLPDYIRAIKGKYGIFIVLWFKDPEGKFFGLPESHTYVTSKAWLEDETSKQNSSQLDFHITSFIIDASIRLAASK